MSTFTNGMPTEPQPSVIDDTDHAASRTGAVFNCSQAHEITPQEKKFIKNLISVVGDLVEGDAPETTARMMVELVGSEKTYIDLDIVLKEILEENHAYLKSKLSDVAQEIRDGSDQALQNMNEINSIILDHLAMYKIVYGELPQYQYIKPLQDIPEMARKVLHEKCKNILFAKHEAEEKAKAREAMKEETASSDINAS